MPKIIIRVTVEAFADNPTVPDDTPADFSLKVLGAVQSPLLRVDTREEIVEMSTNSASTLGKVLVESLEKWERREKPSRTETPRPTHPATPTKN